MTKFAIVTTTYQKADGSTHDQLVRTINSVLDQKYENWKLFLIGDRYEDEDEFNRIAGIVPDEKIFKINRLDVTIERDLYPYPSRKLWCSAGGSSRRYGIQQAIDQGFDYICPLDHDDWWRQDHLLRFANAIKKHPDLFFLVSLSQYKKRGRLPPAGFAKPGIGFFPSPEKVVHSSTCIKFSETDIRTRDVFAETGENPVPADLDLWKRLSKWMKDNDKQGYYTGVKTCFKDSEGEALR